MHGYERFAFGVELPSLSCNHNYAPTTLRTSVKESLQVHFIVTVRNFHALNVTR